MRKIHYVNKLVYFKILYIGTDPKGKGGMATVMRFYQNISKEKFSFICVHRFESKFKQLLRAIGAFFLLLYNCICKPIQIVHIQTASYRSFYRDSVYLLLAKLLGKRVILHIHGGEFELFYNQSPRFCHFICRKADCLMAVSEYFAQIFRNLKLNDNVICLYNPIEYDIERSTSYEKNSLDEKKINIAFFGAIDRNKGVYDILKCWHTHKSFFSTYANLHLAGIGDHDTLNELIDEYGISDLVTYHGWLNDEAKGRLLETTDIYLQPSYFESLGIAILEAMSYQIPIIATRVGGIPELVHHGDNGFLINPGDIDQLFFFIRLLVEDSEMRRIMGEKGFQSVDKFSIQSIKRQVEELYSELL